MQATPELLEAVSRADDVFERHLEAAGDLCAMCLASDREPFESALRPYRARRLELPVTALSQMEMGHGSALVHGSPGRLRWFVPSFLAESLREPARCASILGRLAELVHEARRVGAGLFDAQPADVVLRSAERDALARFAALSLDQALREGRMDEATAVITLAHAAGLDADALARVWLRACDEDEGAVAALLEGVAVAARDGQPAGDRPEDALRLVLAREPVRAWLERAFFAAAGEGARSRFSEAEAALAALL